MPESETSAIRITNMLLGAAALLAMALFGYTLTAINARISTIEQATRASEAMAASNVSRVDAILDNRRSSEDRMTRIEESLQGEVIFCRETVVPMIDDLRREFSARLERVDRATDKQR